jgi:hypothetical protein
MFTGESFCVNPQDVARPWDRETSTQRLYSGGKIAVAAGSMHPMAWRSEVRHPRPCTEPSRNDKGAQHVTRYLVTGVLISLVDFM